MSLPPERGQKDSVILNLFQDLRFLAQISTCHSEGIARKNPANSIKSWIATVVNSFAMTIKQVLSAPYIYPCHCEGEARRNLIKTQFKTNWLFTNLFKYFHDEITTLILSLGLLAARPAERSSRLDELVSLRSCQNPPRNDNKIFTPAFTLAEVLITLGIIGVVAAMTIPGIMTKNKAKRFRAQYLKTYSTIAQSIRIMKNDDVSLDPLTYSGGNSFYKTFATYFKSAHLCGTQASAIQKNNLCYYSGDTSYKTLDGKSTPSYTRFDDGQFLLMDNTLIMLENPYGSANAPLWIHADINGKSNPPNRLGVDVFTFVMTSDEELVPMGTKGTTYTDMDKYCNPKRSNTPNNGFACSRRAMEESDYFEKIFAQIK